MNRSKIPYAIELILIAISSIFFALASMGMATLSAFATHHPGNAAVSETSSPGDNPSPSQDGPAINDKIDDIPSAIWAIIGKIAAIPRDSDLTATPTPIPEDPDPQLVTSVPAHRFSPGSLF